LIWFLKNPIRRHIIAKELDPVDLVSFKELLMANSIMADALVQLLIEDGRVLLIDYHPDDIRFPRGWMYKALIYFFEIAASREHFKNFRSFIGNKGIPGLIPSHKLFLDKMKIVGDGNFGFYLIKRKNII
jgi:hypothetical protein